MPAARRMPQVRVLDALAAGRDGYAAELVFEYMAATQAETGHPWPARVDQLPAVLARECRDLAAAYARPGTLLLAYRDRQPVGCVGLAAREPAGKAEVKRLYVRPAHRGGIGAVLMSHAHRACRGVSAMRALRTEPAAGNQKPCCRSENIGTKSCARRPRIESHG